SPSSGTSTCGATAACRTAASAWASSARWPGSTATTTSARRFPSRGCSTRFPRRSLRRQAADEQGSRLMATTEVGRRVADAPEQVAQDDRPSSPLLAENPATPAGSLIQNWKYSAVPGGTLEGQGNGRLSAPDGFVASGTSSSGAGTSVPPLKGASSSERPKTSVAGDEGFA